MTHEARSIHRSTVVLAGALALALAALPARAQEELVVGATTDAAVTERLAFAEAAVLAAAADLYPGIAVLPTPSYRTLGNCIPFGNNTDYGFTGFILRDVPAFELAVGDSVRFDMGAVQDQDIRRDVYLARANVNPTRWTGGSQGVRPDGGWTQVASEEQIPLNPRGNTTFGDFELTYTAEAPFSFPGGGLIVGFGASPPGTYYDRGCTDSGVLTNASDPSGQFYSRFYYRTDRYTGILDSGSGDTSAISGMVITFNNRPPIVAADAAEVVVDEGQLATNTGTFSDPNAGDDVALSASAGTVTKTGTSGGTWSWSLATTDGPLDPQTVTITATDGRGASATTAFTYAVRNVAPIAGAAAGPAAACGEASGLTISFFDPALANDTYTAWVDWGDGTVESFPSAASGLLVSHAYAKAGLYEATVVVADEDGGVSAPARATAALNFTLVGGGVLQPLDQDGSSVFRYGSTIPVKLRVADCDGSLRPDLAIRLALTQVSGEEPGAEINEPISTSAADATGYMRFTGSPDFQYIYNLATRPLPDPTASYELTLTILQSAQPVTTRFGLK